MYNIFIKNSFSGHRILLYVNKFILFSRKIDFIIIHVKNDLYVLCVHSRNTVKALKRV